MKAGKTEKTNVMRLLDAAEIPYRSMEYPVDAVSYTHLESCTAGTTRAES